MAWKNLSNWIKGSIMGLSAFIILFLITISSTADILVLGTQVHLFLERLLCPNQICIPQPYLMSILFTAIIYLLVGALIGLIIGAVNLKKFANLKNWLKGGIIGVIFYILFVQLVVVYLLKSEDLYFNLNPAEPIMILRCAWGGGGFFCSVPVLFFFLARILIPIILYFGVGALIGWIIGKIKSSKK